MRLSRQFTDTGSDRSHCHSHSCQMEGGGSEVSDSKRELRMERDVGDWAMSDLTCLFGCIYMIYSSGQTWNQG